MLRLSKWAVVYEKAIRDDGSLFFPKKLTHEFLEDARRVMGSFIFANQYLNEIVPSDRQVFDRNWFKYYETIPKRHLTFAMIDPAISESDSADYTALVVVKTDEAGNWYIVHAARARINPTDIVNLVFKVQSHFQCQAIGVEDVAFQKVLLHLISEEMKRRKVIIPVTGVKPPTDKTKEMKILGLVPRFEWGHVFMSQGLTDLELELAQFPRGAHDDLIDALASIDAIIQYPITERIDPNERPAPNNPNYESWYRRQLIKKAREAEG